MIQIRQNFHSIGKTTAPSFLLLVMINVFDVTMNDSNDV